ncbi:cytidine deaminase [uncultured Parabacteroides sp.]|uniref:cytidine deaminase n=1 Tax=uncultured Parabacteroides sp. TaxID=512312 RepID=UPI002605CA1B|nr:cytidine deaminase [uncultured Parabacteroides sp.]
MKELKLETSVEVYAIEELDETYKRLYETAFEASKKAYAPYSNFHVGAAVLLENGEILSGNNQENAAYPSGLCAERTTLFYAGAHYPDTAVRVLAIAGMKDGERVDLITPCGACRQVMLETEQRYDKPMKVLLCGKEEAFLVPSATALLPFCFGKSDLIKPEEKE